MQEGSGVAVTDKYKSFRRQIQKLIEYEQDPPVRCFFCLINEIHDHPHFSGIIEEILSKRPRIEEEHLAYLLFCSFQYVTHFAYDATSGVDRNHYLRLLLKHASQHPGKLRTLCQTRNIATNIPERYSGLQIVLSMLNKRGVTVADIGCSIGLGLMALNTGILRAVKAYDSRLEECLDRRVDVAKAIGIDIMDQNIEWVEACYLPENKLKRPQIHHLYEQLKEQGQEMTFVRGDAAALRDVEALTADSVDVAWISNTCYQIEDDLEKVEDGIKWLLKNGGMWLYAYYRHGDDKRFASPENPYVVKVRIKNRWNESLEVLESPSDQVESIKPGRDFETFLHLLV